MTDTSPLPGVATVARLSADAAAARPLLDVLAESFDPEDVVISAYEAPDGRWPLALYFREPPDESAVRSLVALAAGAKAADSLAFETLAPTDWVRKSLDGLQPVEAGRFVVHGSHDRARIQPNRIGIEIEAGLAFGTGHHATTRGCLLALDRIIKRHRPGRTLDIGSGTGVLAIAAVKALHQPAFASDIDLRAVRTARENARLNRAGTWIEIVHTAGLRDRRFRSHAPFGIAFANILLAPLRQLAGPMARLVTPGGHIVLSGLLETQVLPALGAYLPHGLKLVRRIPLDGWITLVLERKAAKSVMRRGRRHG